MIDATLNLYALTLNLAGLIEDFASSPKARANTNLVDRLPILLSNHVEKA